MDNLNACQNCGTIRHLTVRESAVICEGCGSYHIGTGAESAVNIWNLNNRALTKQEKLRYASRRAKDLGYSDKEYVKKMNNVLNQLNN